MYAQLTDLRVPVGKMSVLRDMIEQTYLPIVAKRPGFVSAYLLEQVDDAHAAQMIQFWDTHASAENFMRTGMLASSIQALAADIPGLKVQRQGYIVRVAVEAFPAPALAIHQN
jgi:hypothetical protein